jgi:transposase-like protein
VRGVKARRVHVDEIWSFTNAKNKNVEKATAAPEGAGDTWTWTAIDADSKLLISRMVGDRDTVYASAFMNDLASRLANRVQLTSDGLKVYMDAIEEAFGGDVDFAQLVKILRGVGRERDALQPGQVPWRYPARGLRRTRPKTHQHELRRARQPHDADAHAPVTRLTNGFSKKVANHAHMVALYTAFYNFTKIHKTLKVTPRNGSWPNGSRVGHARRGRNDRAAPKC